ncbi:PorP/SprF family type IX secretion system membrane protein [Spirosoma aureum]|uniref:PorP/SprF family type IX secretion system membrane protein n=1 Tax=Spirosoma aureum TaxID=2692134 RepID=A0A6G9ARI0_9BACT|nr:PorP/SprF family type IX secretion system membrane protein [Spirosoma aureum]QIP14823.1 PorP/SprF family type IX secretion system membrane protein [Spirosoma aureum]
MPLFLRNVVLSALLVCWSILSYAQDPQFSQFYANPIYHNPAFAGGAGSARLIANYRSQWPALPASYHTAAFSFDSYDEDHRLGAGVQLIGDWQGSAFQTTQVSGQASYMVPLMQDSDREARLIFGLQAAYIGNQINPGGMSFADQYALGGLVNQVSNDPLSQGTFTRKSVDFTGGLLFEHELGDNLASYWAGLTVNHIGRSQLRGDWLGQRISGMAGIKLPFEGRVWNKGYAHQQNRDQSIGLTGYLRQQGNNLQLDVGLNLIYSPLMLGLWYRGIPLRKIGQTTFQSDALVGIIAFQFDQLMVQYSYDVTLSSMRYATGGAHEISIWYGFDSLFQFGGKNRNLKRQRRCQQF